MKKSLPPKSSYIVYAFVAFVVLVLIAALHQGTRTKQETVPPAPPAPLVYNKGDVSFSYPGDWKTNDIPAGPDFISVQVSDPQDFIVFVASSAKAFNEIKMKEKPQVQKGVMLGGVGGMERLWENDKTRTAVFRADHFEFQNRFYRFEMFTSRSREVKADRILKDILASVKFATSTQDAIQATPKK